jgi:hypothetical protein
MKGQLHQKIHVAIATKGRPKVLKETLAMLGRQTRKPDSVLVAPAQPADLAGIHLLTEGCRHVVGPAGLCAQRNSILSELVKEDVQDIVVFFDDDYFPCKDYLAAVERAFVEEPDIVMTTGALIADGIKGPGISVASGRALVEQAEWVAKVTGRRVIVYNGYGCNMAFRLAPVLQGMRFDERLPQYGWLEDVDFSRRLAPYGRIVKLPDARGVHLGTKSGRTPGIRLGYSQIANPLYLVKKGTLTPRKAFLQMSRNFAMNCLRSFRPEAYIDRRGRLCGNFIGLVDAANRREDPEKVNSFV